jgi:hypothetical protein
MPRIGFIGLMLCLIFYIFGVMFTQLFKDLYVEGYTDYNYFGDLEWTFFTLFQMMTMDNWASITRQVVYVYKWSWLPFTLFVIISGFIVANLIIAVICDAIGALHADDKAKLLGDYDKHAGSNAGGGDNKDDNDNSKIMDIRKQLDHLEGQLVDLTRLQARTCHTLQILTQQIQLRKYQQEAELKSWTTAARVSSSKANSPITTTTTSPTITSSPPLNAAVAGSNALPTFAPTARHYKRKELLERVEDEHEL